MILDSFLVLVSGMIGIFAVMGIICISLVVLNFFGQKEQR